MTKWKLIPVEPTELQWGGLARDIFMAWDTGCRTPRDLFAHLDMILQPIPQWLRDEPEMQNLDHVPSKGTRAAIIYRAMLEAAPPPPKLSDERIREIWIEHGLDDEDVEGFARAIEREILGAE